MTKSVYTPLLRIAFLAVAALFMFSSVAAHAATATVIPGKKVTLSVAANGTAPFSYQWQKNGVNINGANASTYVMTSVVTQDSGYYTVAVSNQAGSTVSDIGALTVTPNAITYNNSTFPARVIPGTVVSFTYNVTNTGTNTWGGNHYLSLRTANGTYLDYTSLSGVASGGSMITNALSFTAPSTPGTYTYYVQALENGAGSFSTQATLVLTVSATLQNSIRYNSSTFPAQVTPGAAVNFTYNVTNTGTKTWGANHYLSLRKADGTYLDYASLSGVAAGGTAITGGMGFIAPTTPGTYTYYVQALENGVEFFDAQTTLVLTVAATLPNAITYNSSTFPARVTPGAAVSFTYNVTNTGTNAWGTNHYLSLRSSNGTYLAYTYLNGVAAGGSATTAGLTFTAPTTPGTYTYYVQALENGVGFFNTQTTLVLTVAATLPNAVTYNSSTFPARVVPGTTVRFTYNLTNIGTKTWGGNHYLSLRTAGGIYLDFTYMSGPTSGGSLITDYLTFTAPTTPGTYTYYVQAVENGVELFDTQETLTLTVAATLPNAIIYNSTNFPVTVAAGSPVSFSYNVTNTGTKTWGGNHYLSLRTSAGTYLDFTYLTGIASGASYTTGNMGFTAPLTPGTYKYYIQALENGVELFDTQTTLTLTVL